MKQLQPGKLDGAMQQVQASELAGEGQQAATGKLVGQEWSMEDKLAGQVQPTVRQLNRIEQLRESELVSCRLSLSWWVEQLVFGRLVAQGIPTSP